MQIVSYRGPSQPGGVSKLIEQSTENDRSCRWLFIENDRICSAASTEKQLKTRVPAQILQGHYRFCNEFLWPLMHSRPDLMVYSADHYNCYRELNVIFASRVNWEREAEVFIHDYQFAVLPRYISEELERQKILFWHIPWPDTVPDTAVPLLMEIAIGLLACHRVGFHTEGYAKNFALFVKTYLPECVFEKWNTISYSGHRTELIVNPAGVDYSFWQSNSFNTAQAFNFSTPYVFSVDRADYSKGVLERIKSVEIFFDRRPDLIGQLQFVFACQPTRGGLNAFDEYWIECMREYEAVNAKLSVDGWKPIVWIKESLTSSQLAILYGRASLMLVNPSVDGLNLTAKEFIASSRNLCAALVLSSGAGAWQELREHVISVHTCTPEAIAEALLRALVIPTHRVRADMLALKRIVHGNTVEKWWQIMTVSEIPERQGNCA